MSVLSRKRAAEADPASTRARTLPPARPIVLARAAVPVAKTAGIAARDGVRSAAAWATPRVNGARAWTAPHIERSGLAIRDTIAPKICEMLTATARRVDVTAPRAGVAAPRRRWPKVVGRTRPAHGRRRGPRPATAVVLRRRKDDGTGRSSGETAGAGTSPQVAEDGQSRPGADGGDAEADVSRSNSAT